MRRTGCVGCPFAKNIVDELKLMKQYEPKMFRACMNVFGDAYHLMDEYGMRGEKICDI